jgi:hypothetical protein
MRLGPDRAPRKDNWEATFRMTDGSSPYRRRKSRRGWKSTSRGARQKNCRHRNDPHVTSVRALIAAIVALANK